MIHCQMNSVGELKAHFKSNFQHGNRIDGMVFGEDLRSDAMAIFLISIF
jgi:hypothetical protein